jgi:hypothetical protein
LHAAAPALHCATHAPDKPQFWAQEKLIESQLAMHSANVRDCASRSLSTAVAALLDVAPNRTRPTAATNLMASFPDVGVKRLRNAKPFQARLRRPSMPDRDPPGSCRQISASARSEAQRPRQGRAVRDEGRRRGLRLRHASSEKTSFSRSPGWLRQGRIVTREQSPNTPLLVFKSDLLSVGLRARTQRHSICAASAGHYDV